MVSELFGFRYKGASTISVQHGWLHYAAMTPQASAQPHGSPLHHTNVTREKSLVLVFNIPVRVKEDPSVVFSRIWILAEGEGSKFHLEKEPNNAFLLHSHTLSYNSNKLWWTADVQSTLFTPVRGLHDTKWNKYTHSDYNNYKIN